MFRYFVFFALSCVSRFGPWFVIEKTDVVFLVSDCYEKEFVMNEVLDTLSTGVCQALLIVVCSPSFSRTSRRLPFVELFRVVFVRFSRGTMFATHRILLVLHSRCIHLTSCRCLMMLNSSFSENRKLSRLY